ncbi:MAG: DUF5680 domain-containing protein [Candidatus Vogelbacteria bacterium]|nr:DUF5680 domain-containing protein [Candidatus Vogelbacteria bacterium]
MPIQISQLHIEVLDAFFDAMLAGYTAETKPAKVPVPELPGAKCTKFTQGRYQVIDLWWTGVDPRHSFGQTIITRDGVPIWQMGYAGWYEPEAIPFLKEALRETYAKRIFLGGRGPVHYQKTLEYCNRIDIDQSWKKFQGREDVYQRSKQSKLLGYHEYRGGLLINL